MTERALATCTRKVRHPGCLKYALPFDRACRRALPASLPYPKFTAAPPLTEGCAA